MRLRRGVLIVGLLAVVPLDAGRFARADEVDCGTVALYYLLEIEGKPRTLAEVRAALPAHDERGFSLRELADSAHRFGLDLDGGRSLNLDHSPDRPVIAFLKRPEHGHYVVLRPVGHTRNLVQVLDGRNPPEVLDMTAFQAEQGWTGLCLVPRRWWVGSGWSPLGATIFLGTAWTIGWIWRRGRVARAAGRASR